MKQINTKIPFGESFRMIMINDRMITYYSEKPLKLNLKSDHENCMNNNNTSN